MDLKLKTPKIELNIDEIVVDGGSHISQAQLRQVVEQELVRQMGKNALPKHHKTGNSKVNIDELNLKTAPDSGVQDIGHQVAHQVQTAEPIKSFCGGVQKLHGAVFSKRAPMVAEGKETTK